MQVKGTRKYSSLVKLQQAFPFQLAASNFHSLWRAQSPVTKQTLAIEFAYLALREVLHAQIISTCKRLFTSCFSWKGKLCTVVLNTKIWYLLTNNNVFVQSTKFIDNNKHSIIVQKGLSLCLLPWRSSKGSNSFVWADYVALP